MDSNVSCNIFNILILCYLYEVWYTCLIYIYYYLSCAGKNGFLLRVSLSIYCFFFIGACVFGFVVPRLVCGRSIEIMLETYFSDLERVLGDTEKLLDSGATSADLKRCLSQCRSLIKCISAEVAQDRTPTRVKNKWTLKAFKKRFADVERRCLLLPTVSGKGAAAAKSTPSSRGSRSLENLEAAKRTVAETSELAEGILDELHGQKDTIRSAHGKAKELDGEMTTAGKILKGMSRWWRG